MSLLSLYGDVVEKDYSSCFIEDKFPSYIKVWEVEVLPYRENDSLYLKTTAPEKNKQIAQWNYNVLINLSHCYDLEKLKDRINADYKLAIVIDFFNRAYCVIESLRKLVTIFTDPSVNFRTIPKWLISENSYPNLKRVGNYRRPLTHGFLFPKGINHNKQIFIPKLGILTGDDGLAWGKNFSKDDYDLASNVVSQSWKCLCEDIEMIYKTEIEPLLSGNNDNFISQIYEGMYEATTSGTTFIPQ
jgi:hypothetical protein